LKEGADVLGHPLAGRNMPGVLVENKQRLVLRKEAP
jgi:hypothetical protein